MALEKGLEKELDEFRFYRGSVVGIIIAIVGSLLMNFKSIPNVLIFCGVGAVIVLLLILTALTFAIVGKIKEIKAL